MIGLLLCITLLPIATTVRAEGSVNLTQSGDRPYLDYRSETNPDGKSAGILRQTIIKVFAKAGETIDLGSSAMNVGQGNILFSGPDGAVSSDCKALQTQVSGPANYGQIRNRTEEVNGPQPNPNGYLPCIISSAMTTTTGDGVWEIRFVSPNPEDNNDPTPVLANQTWPGASALQPQPDGVSWVAAWDVTVRNPAGVAIPGRVYANYLALNLGDNGYSLEASVYVQTYEGYRYHVNLNGLDPYGFIFFSNNKGFTDKATGNQLYKSIALLGVNPNYTLPPNVSVLTPNTPDGSGNYTHKIFFDEPASDLPTSAKTPDGTDTWLLVTPQPPPKPTNFTFIGAEGTPGQTGTGNGGTFYFDNPSPDSHPYTLILDLNQDNVYGNGNDRVMPGVAQPGQNEVPWDGKDGNGQPVETAGNLAYNVRLTFNSGEVHFPFIDAENNPNGFIMERLLPDNIPPDPSNPRAYDPDLVYYNDASLGGEQALDGVNSASGAHIYTDAFGDGKGIDTWAYIPSPPAVIEGGIIIAQADLAITKTHTPEPATRGGGVTYSVQVTNNGPSNVKGAQVTDDVPSSITNVSWSCAVTAGNGKCGDLAGVGNVISTTVDLNAEAVATYTISGTIDPNAPTTIVNNATVTRPPDVTEPDLTNNSASDTLHLKEPTAITLSSFTAAPDGKNIAVRWTTSSEINTFGFNLYRSVDGTRSNAVRITPQTIPGQGHGQAGASYVWSDTDVQSGVIYSYWLQEIDTSGITTEYGPVATSLKTTTDTPYRIALPLITQ